MSDSFVENQDQGVQEWVKDYNECLENVPKPGDILKAFGDGKAVIAVELREGAPPFMYGKVFVPEVLGAALGWYLQSEDNRNFHGWKCILLPQARTELIRKLGLSTTGVVTVTSLRVVRVSKTGSSLLCEVAEY